jgi:hypothetical protein
MNGYSGCLTVYYFMMKGHRCHLDAKENRYEEVEIFSNTDLLAGLESRASRRC